MITNVSEFTKHTFLRLFGYGTWAVEAHGHKLERRFGNGESKIISIDGGPWLESLAAQRKFARIIRADQQAERRIKAEYMAERKMGA